MSEITPDDVAQLIIGELEERKGFDSFWDDIDEDIQEEIITAISLIVYDNPLSSRR